MLFCAELPVHFYHIVELRQTRDRLHYLGAPWAVSFSPSLFRAAHSSDNKIHSNSRRALAFLGIRSGSSHSSKHNSLLRAGPCSADLGRTRTNRQRSSLLLRVAFLANLLHSNNSSRMRPPQALYSEILPQLKFCQCSGTLRPTHQTLRPQMLPEAVSLTARLRLPALGVGLGPISQRFRDSPHYPPSVPALPPPQTRYSNHPPSRRKFICYDVTSDC